MKIVTAKDQQETTARKEIRWGLAALLVLALLALIPRCQEEERRGPERLPPAAKLITFRVSPKGVPALALVLTDGSGEQQAFQADVPGEAAFEGKVFWTALAPGYLAAIGTLELPYGESPEPVEVRVELEAMGASSARTSPSADRTKNRRP